MKITLTKNITQNGIAKAEITLKRVIHDNEVTNSYQAIIKYYENEILYFNQETPKIRFSRSQAIRDAVKIAHEQKFE